MTSNLDGNINIQTVYSILRKYARNKSSLFYAQLSEEYRLSTGIWHEPHGSWDYPLGAVNNFVSASGFPPITALVIRQDTLLPGNSFWGCAANVPERPANETLQRNEHVRLMNEVFAVTWPVSLP